MRAIVLSAALLLTTCAVEPAMAQVGCASRDEVLKGMEKEFGEKPVAFMLDQRGVVIELLATPGGETWTLILTRPDGISCAKGLSGFNYNATPLPAPKGDPA